MPGGICQVKKLSRIMDYEEEIYKLSLPPAVMIHGLGQARLALRLGRPVTLLSAAGAASNWGCSWWGSLLAAAAHNGPALLDCGAAPGRAVEALALGLRGIVLAPCPTWAEVAALARQNQALLLAAPPEALDLGQKQRESALIAWLSG